MNPEQITAELRDIKPAVDIPEAAAGLSPYAVTAIIAAILLLVALAAWWFYRRRQRGTVARDPVTDALRELDTARQILHDADSEAYAIAVSNVLRRYLERHLDSSAVRQTTDEFFAQLAEDSDSPLRRHRDSLREFLAQCDLVKFARGELGKLERERLHDTARDFITSTARTSDGSDENFPEPTQGTASAAA